MNKTRTYVFSLLLAALMVTACTLEGDLETVKRRAGIEVDDPYDPYNPSNNQLSAPSGVMTEGDTGIIYIWWNEVSGASGYNVYRSSSASGSFSKIGSAYYEPYYMDASVNANTTYYYKVSAYNSSGEGPQSSYVSARTDSSSSSGGAPNAPSSVTASSSSASSGSINVSWSSVSGANVYYVYRSSSASGYYNMIGTAYTTSYTDTGLSANTTYYYKVSASNSYGEGSQSSYTYATTGSSSSSSPSSPINLTLNQEYYNTLSANATHTYRFYASSTGYYYIQWDDADTSYGYGYADIKVGVKNDGSSSYIVDLTDTGNFIQFYASRSGYYIIEVRGLDSSSSGPYYIGVTSDYYY